jgi:uncharacterized protein YkwD
MRHGAGSIVGRAAVVGVAALALVVVLLVTRPHVARTDSVAPTPVERDFVRTVNAVRAQHGLQPVRTRPALTRAARAHTHDMLAQQVFAHGVFWKRLERFGIRTGAMGENLAWSSSEARAAPRLVEARLESPEHRDVLLDPRYSEVGIGAASGDFLGHRGAIVVTADFHGAARRSP